MHAARPRCCAEKSPPDIAASSIAVCVAQRTDIVPPVDQHGNLKNQDEAAIVNKAFTKEADSDEELTPLPEMPVGVRNYITRAGYAALQQALQELTDQQSIGAAEPVIADDGNDTDSSSEKLHGTRDVDQRIHYLRTRIDSAEIVDPSVHAGNDQIFFGATVTYRDQIKQKHVVTIVGLDELDPAIGKISWLSPVAQALLNAHEGDSVQLDGPTGVETLQIVSVQYPQTSE